MNLSKLFEIQAQLDNRIIESKGLQDQDLLDEKILALQVELGELANEWREFKFWKVDPRPNIEEEVKCSACNGTGDLNYDMVQENAESDRRKHEYIDCDECDCSGVSGVRNPLLEEYVDCLHFILSIGLDLEMKEVSVRRLSRTDIVFVFGELFEITSKLRNVHGRKYEYEWLMREFVKLGEMLGFTEAQIEQAYLDKNKVNHERQANGY